MQPSVNLNNLQVSNQVLCDKYGNCIHLGERDCSIQRRNQKLLEEAPSPALTPELRKRMGSAAVAAASSIGYVGVGTVEFLLDSSGDFYFMEMNTRIQVEHPVTEMIYSIDLIEEQIRVAMGKKLRYTQNDVKLCGHAIECRINAEDAFQGFRPGPGLVTAYLPPGGPFVRMDSHLYADYLVPPTYDSLLGKLVVWAPTREKAITRMQRALRDTVVTGIPTTVDYHKLILEIQDFKEGKVDTSFILKHEAELSTRDKPRVRAPLGLLKPLAIPAGPGQSVSMDFMDTLLTRKSGKRHIFVIVDRFTKFARLIAMPETARTEHVIKLFMDNWVRDFGLPKTIVNDRDVRFTSEMWKKAAEQMGSQLQMTFGNHPKANGQAGQMNRVVQHLLRHYIKPSQDDWDEKLPLIASLYNNAVHSTTGVNPNQLHLGWKPRSALDFLLPENRPAATPRTIEFGAQYEKLLQQAVKHIKKSQEAMFASENKHRRQSTFQVGELVWVKSSELGQEFGISRKLVPQYFGPWEVLDVVDSEEDGPSYVIRIPGHLRSYPVFHASKLAPFAETQQFPSRRSMLPPTMDGHVDVDDILEHRDMPVPKPVGRGTPKPKREYRADNRPHIQSMTVPSVFAALRMPVVSPALYPEHACSRSVLQPHNATTSPKEEEEHVESNASKGERQSERQSEMKREPDGQLVQEGDKSLVAVVGMGEDEHVQSNNESKRHQERKGVTRREPLPQHIFNDEKSLVTVLSKNKSSKLVLNGNESCNRGEGELLKSRSLVCT
ncbi:hypothetical protein CBR_g39917 [Chara braunii]|uniref:Integrase catalytic domain-containing protein n=1 Tax=Chara braunii TaxID=69332 RepID=A0A388K1H8_CHABU|nr:hypothetical protein CBR_g39917 [Chara braunii]|eukprot:GBG63912.1 hypothetical protein CBR_g39917 [Chara braunii]